MQETLNLISKPIKFPSHNYDSPSLSRRPRTQFKFPPKISSKTITGVAIPPPIRSPAPPPPPSDFQEKVYYLDSIGLDAFSLVTDHRPILLSASLSNIKSAIDFLASMDFNSYDFRRIVTLCPEFLSTASASTLIPVFTFLLREASVQPFNIREVIRRRPKLLLCSVDNQLRPTLRFLQTIGISTAFKHTYLLSCSVEGMLVPRIRYFQDLGFSYRESASMLKRFPQLFSYNLKENIEPKLEYYVEEMGRDLKELKEFPQYFSYSLENRTKPRHLSCVERGVCMPLAVMLRTNDSHFRQRLESFSDESLLPVSSSPLSRVESDDPVIDTQET